MPDVDDPTRRHLLRRAAAGAATAGLLSGAGVATSSGPTAATPVYGDADLDLRWGNLHAHTAYSDGAAGSRPSDAYASGRAAGYDFMAVTEHSEWLPLPVEADEDCVDPRSHRLPQDCVMDPREEPDGLRKWDAQREQARAASTDGFLGLRGFEWSSQYQGHVVVLGSQNYSTAYETGGATMHGFWEWFTRDPALGGGSDGLAFFAHPGREPETFEDFRYVPEAADRVVGVEVFNRGADYFEGGLPVALDAGWRVGAVGSSDHHGAKWGRAGLPRTVLVVPGDRAWTRETIRETLLARRFYATFNHALQLRVRADGREMGSTVRAAPGETVDVVVDAHDPAHDDSVVGIVLYSNGGEPVASVELDAPDRRASLRYRATVPASGADWYVAKVRGVDGTRGPARGDAYASPVWIEAA